MERNLKVLGIGGGENTILKNQLIKSNTGMAIQSSSFYSGGGGRVRTKRSLLTQALVEICLSAGGSDHRGCVRIIEFGTKLGR